MTDAIAKYRTSVSGLWSTRHAILEDGASEPTGILTIERNGYGLVVRGQYQPAKGELLRFRRDPGLLRSQFSMWTEGREWLGSSLRWSNWKREVAISTGTRPIHLVPIRGFRRGWRLIAPKTGEMACIDAGILGRGARIEVYRRMDFEVVLFAYFLGFQLYAESFWPGPPLEGEHQAPSPSKA